MLACRVQSVEHLLSALEACGVDNARIEIEGGPEVPIVDGSALSWAMDLHRVRLKMYAFSGIPSSCIYSHCIRQEAGRQLFVCNLSNKCLNVFWLNRQVPPSMQ